MTETITLPRAVVEQVREALLSFDNWWDDEADTALTALDAALAEPDAKREPATVEQIDEEYIKPDIDGRWRDFELGFRAAERFHGIGGSKT
jgi:hypothetical protein